MGWLLKLEAYIKYNTAHDIFKLDGEVHEKVMSSEKSDINHFYEIEWFEWVIFWD